ncbi:SGNH hydrolase-type esterase domain-containing protein [Ilyonectria sp. MPI-CAGE-AT-0026]|nr:SGNH hydrolase-type esterase domain-containing protein [Ilyonectria sp. MPI-CAGE-AT-0026]
MVALNLLSLNPMGLLLLSATAVTAAPTPKPYTPPTHYVAFGDSFAAGLGAGWESGPGHLDGCYRYDRGYPSALQGLIDDEGDSIIKAENLKACTGAKADQVKAQAEFLDETVDLATISVGINDVGFGNIVNDCIYRFKGSLSGNCQSTLNSSRNYIKNDLGPAVQDTLQAFMDRPHHENLRIFVTGYAQLFHSGPSEQCDGLSWNYWQDSPESGSGQNMTQALRVQLNELVVAVNNKINEVVRSFDDEKIHFVDYDYMFNRFCEEGFVEPQPPNEERPDQLMHQYYTPDHELYQYYYPRDQKLHNVSAYRLEVSVSAEAQNLAQGMLEFANSHPDVKVAAPFNEHPVNITMLPDHIPVGIMKAFHPTQKGHETIAREVWKAYRRKSTDGPGSTLPPLPKNFHIGDSGTRVSGNFPRTFGPVDDNLSVRSMLYGMRDQNCWDATKRMIDERMTDYVEPIYTASWVNGSDHEYYNVGIRDYQPDGCIYESENLGHLHVACRRFENIFSDRYEVYLSNWDDGDKGKSIRHAVEGCHMFPTKWKYKEAPTEKPPLYIPADKKAPMGTPGLYVLSNRTEVDKVAPTDQLRPYTFEDGTEADKWVKWYMMCSTGKCVESMIEEVLGLRAGGLKCPFGEWFEMDLFN